MPFHRWYIFISAYVYCSINWLDTSVGRAVGSTIGQEMGFIANILLRITACYTDDLPHIMYNVCYLSSKEV